MVHHYYNPQPNSDGCYLALDVFLRWRTARAGRLQAPARPADALDSSLEDLIRRAHRGSLHRYTDRCVLN